MTFSMKIIITIFFFLASQEFFAQTDSLLLDTKYCPSFANKQFILKGIIYDIQTNEELPYATILVKGTKIGTQSDVKGLFALDITALLDSTKTLVIIGSYVGYDIKEVEIKDIWNLGTYSSIPMVSNSGISCPGIEVLPEKGKSLKKKPHRK